jgi:conjugative relaxase-like TrwC/TraI family protein
MGARTRHGSCPAGACDDVLSLWKLRVGVETYYLAQVASGLDEYYTGAGEAAGRWTGTAAPLLGLSGEVGGEDLRAVLAGLAPDMGLTPNGTRLAGHPRRVPGFDLTFSVPKSVSVVYALGDPLVQSQVVDGCEAALNDALAWLEREACFVRRGTNNGKMAGDPDGFGTRRMIAEGFVAAQFPHRTSRAGDPHLHWHVLVANMARGIDGRWSALDGTALYRAQRSAGVLFQAAMRQELSRRLGVYWGPIHKDSAEIAGVPSRILREFSQRHDKIAEWLEQAGRAGAAAAAEALLDTRTSKQTVADFTSVEAAWHERADSLSWGPVQLDRLLASAQPTPEPVSERWVIRERVWRADESTTVVRVVGFDEWLEWLLETRVSEKESTFTRFDLTQAVAAELPVRTTIEHVEGIVRRALGSPEIVQVGDHWAERRHTHAPDRIVAGDRQLRYTARSLIAVERRLLDLLTADRVTDVGTGDSSAVEEVIAASTLGDDQAEAVRAIATGGDPIAVMVGRAGTGKTHTLGALRAVYENAGWRVAGSPHPPGRHASWKQVPGSPRRRSLATESNNATSRPTP